MTTALISAHAAGMLAKSSGITLDPIAKPLAAVLAFFYSIIPNYGIAIFLLTVAMMLVLTPLSIKQTRSMLVMQKLQPQLKRLQETHKNDRQALNEAVMALYKEHGASPLGGCLPMLLPLPVFIALLRVLEGLSRTVHGKSVPKYLSSNTRMYMDIVHAKGQLDAFGMNLAKSARTINGSFGTKLPYFVLLLLMVGTQYYQQAQLTSRNPQASSQPGQATMMRLIPLFFGLISIQFPAGVVIYWTVSNVIRIASQTLMYRYDPKVKALVTQDIKEVEARTKEIGADGADAKPPGRPRLRDLLGGASNAVTGRDGNGGKGPAKPGGRPGNNRTAPGGKGAARPRPGGGRTSGPAKPGTAKAGPAKPGTTNPGTAKGLPNKPGTTKGGPVRSGQVRAGTAKPGAARPGASAKAGPTKASPTKAGAPQTDTSGAKPESGRSGPPKPDGARSGEPKPAAGGRGGGAKAPAANDVAAAAGSNGNASSGAAANGGTTGNGSPSKGRTGAGNARSVGSRHRRTRKGR